MIAYDDTARDEGLKIFKNGLVRRLSQTHFIAKLQSGDAWHLIELRNGAWRCDCNESDKSCMHLYAALLQRSTAKLQPEIRQISNADIADHPTYEDADSDTTHGA
jgi:hypothetical protein